MLLLGYKCPDSAKDIILWKPFLNADENTQTCA